MNNPYFLNVYFKYNKKESDLIIIIIIIFLKYHLIKQLIEFLF